ncbi:MAG TPA: HAMP domain-containing sensor histidine kinase [Parafilimonas sp.]|nr:HAMP domain-containing sensor histidine kinase [Parafilimonas sp.]
MKVRFNLFKRIIIFIFLLITVLSCLFIVITYFTTREFYQSSTQLVNKDVAGHIAKFASPFKDSGINKQTADSVFYNAMVLNPSIEVYFLDTTGKIMYYQSPDSTIKLWKIPLENIQKHIQSNGDDYIKGPDPKQPDVQKVFSAVEVIKDDKKLGYIYVILTGNEYNNAAHMLFGTHATSFAIIALCVIIILSVVLSYWYVNRLQRSFKKIIAVLNEYMKGDFNVRFEMNDRDEFAPITNSFNKMATLLSYNIERLKQTEQERKDFIATISHDLRTPLSVAKGYAETALDKMHHGEINKPELDGFIQLVHKKLQQIEIMVQDLFELSRMESVHFTLNKEPFIFSEILEEMISVYEKRAVEKNIELTCDVPANIIWINADIRLMERVIQNLLDNAIKYTPSNGFIHITLAEKENSLELKFTNSGAVLSDDILNWINLTASSNTFSTIHKPANTGLGLLIVKKIVGLHQYSFHVEVNEQNTISFIIQMQKANQLKLNPQI